MSSNINIKKIGNSFFINVIKELNSENILVTKVNQLKDNDYVKKDVLKIIGPDLNLSLKNYERMLNIQQNYTKIHTVLNEDQKIKLDNLEATKEIDKKELNDATNELKNLIKESTITKTTDYK